MVSRRGASGRQRVLFAALALELGSRSGPGGHPRTSHPSLEPKQFRVDQEAEYLEDPIEAQVGCATPSSADAVLSEFGCAKVGSGYETEYDSGRSES